MMTPFEGPVAKAQMMIRKPVDEVFRSLIDPAITSHFWFSKGSGPLEAGKRIRWDWEMYGVHAEADVKEIEKDKRILIEWNGPDNLSRSVHWQWRYSTLVVERLN